MIVVLPRDELLFSMWFIFKPILFLIYLVGTLSSPLPLLVSALSDKTFPIIIYAGPLTIAFFIAFFFSFAAFSVYYLNLLAY